MKTQQRSLERGQKELPNKEVRDHSHSSPGTSAAAMASCPDSDNSWVLAGTESLPVETLGPESRADPESDMAPESTSEAGGEELAGTVEPEETHFKSEGSQSGAIPFPPEELEAKGALGGDGGDAEPPSPGDTVAQSDLQETSLLADLEMDTQGVDDQSPPQSLPSSPKSVRLMEELHCSSSDDDTDVDIEGLRRRRGRDPSPAQPSTPPGAGDQAGSEGVVGELGISLNMCLLGALVMLGLGILLFSEPLEEGGELQVLPETGWDTESQETVAVGGQAHDAPREPMQASAPPGSVPSLQSMALLLDKLAKENQDIRLLQAQLQAQKEELLSLASQPKGLQEENARLRGALQQGEAAQRALEAELQQLRARLQGLEAGCVRGPDGVCLHWGRGLQAGKAPAGEGPGGQEPDPGFLKQKEQLEAEAQALRQELEQQRRLLSSVQQELARSLREAGGGHPAQSSLAKLGHRLAQKLQGQGQDPRVPANASGTRGPELPSQSPRERGGKEKWREGQGDGKAEYWKPKQEEPGRERERKKSWDGGKGKEAKQQGPKELPRKEGRPQPPRERQKHPQWKEGARGRQDPLPPWAELLRQEYRAPQGCSGVTECARQEGLAAFGVELAPVRQQELAHLLRTYLARLPWAGPLTEQLPLSPAYFGEDGIFRHDRLRFRDFVDALEDSLEEVALRQTGDDDEVDDFEDFVFSHFFGDRARKKRSGKKDKHIRGPRVFGPREEHSHQHRG
ncbi:pre-B-cell leukemia transcription factor-interacting protein 1 isoform X2 [Tenrec ecaudatus]|uniref:pre-B-cell leukemia transcription factor-interacting protein 1 isoform X2 n=1 Tax=Tenrec ecaudatus TaxID=94439 RepID=UPI003F597D30